MLDEFLDNKSPGEKIALAFALILAIGIAGVFWFRLRPAPVAPGTDASVTPPNASSSPEAVNSPRSGLSRRPPLPPYGGEPVETLAADPEVLAKIPVETYEKSKRELAELAAALAADPRRGDDWKRVAFIKQFYRDYAGARDVYEYLTLIAGADALPYYNLGTLYGYYLKNQSEALKNFKAALARSPLDVSFRIGLADFYRDVVKDGAAAEQTLLEGLAKIPNDTSLQLALGSLYRASGDNAKAVEYYELALGGGDIGAAERASLEKEVERLKQLLAR